MSNHSSISTFEQLKAAVTKGDKWKGELVSTTKTGQTFIFSLSANPVENDFGFITNHVILGQDVTPFRETEKKLKNAVEEKSVLLSELHHRVKNVQSKLFSSVGRVQTMASMHELLYESGSFSKVEFGKNVKKIVSTTSKVYYDIGKDIKVKLDVESVKLNINQAHPCSLILNEVITNAYKHAFKGREQKAGKIYIQLYTQKNHVFISIVDNGIGLPSDLDVDTDNETQYLGTTLLKTLVSQLNGSYQYTSDCFGTTFTLNFKKEDVKGSASAGFTRS
jgi:two-component sensor histidine kinase